MDRKTQLRLRELRDLAAIRLEAALRDVGIEANVSGSEDNRLRIELSRGSGYELAEILDEFARGELR